MSQPKSSVRLLIIAILMIISNIPHAKGQQEFNLAMEYFNSKDFDKASVLLESLLQKKFNETYLRYYLHTLVELKKYSEVEKTIKQYRQRSNNNPSMKVDIGNIYKLMGKYKESERYFRDALSESLVNRNSVISVANRFINSHEYAWAEKTYFEAKKKIKGVSFEQDLATLYYYMRKYGEMVDIYLNLLAESEAFLQMVQNRLHSAIYSDTDKSLLEIVETKLLLKIQQYPDKDVFNEMLIWIYIRQNNYAKAYIQARSLDLRNNELGNRLMPLAQSAIKSRDYETALKAYNNILEYGSKTQHYTEAYKEKLSLLYVKVKEKLDTDSLEIARTLNSYKDAIEKFGFKYDFFNTILNYIELKALYANETNEALDLIEKVEKIRGLTSIDKAKTELLKADIMLYENKIWDASLIYAKVERNNKEHPIGYEAKYRKVKMAFFQHDFEWAKSQIDIIKASTSKLTSNDAIEMSILLYEGWSETDSTQTTLKMYATAQLKHLQKRNSEAIDYFDSIADSGENFIAVEALNRKGTILQTSGAYKQAAETYEKALEKYKDETNTDFSLFQLGKLYMNRLDNKQKAIELFTTLLRERQSSIYCIETRSLIQKIRQSQVD